MKQLDKVAIVTGASMGIGKAICHILADEGCHLVCAARSAAKIDAVAEEIRVKGRKAIAVTTDVGDPDAVQKMVDATMAEFGRIDILINNAGGPLAGLNIAPPDDQDVFFDIMDGLTFAKISDEQWKTVFDINLYGSLNCVRAVLPVMMKQDAGHILNISSKAGKMKEDVVPGMIAYATSKAALSRFSEVLAFELMCAGSEVKVNALSPGMIATTLHENMPEEQTEGFGKPEDIKDSLLKILDDENPANGEIFAAEGCRTWVEEIQSQDDD